MKQHLKVWRTVRNDPTMVAAPSYWHLAQARRMLVPKSVHSSPRIRQLMNAHAACTNVLNEKCVLDISQGVDRVAIRLTGEMLTLTRTCGNIFAPGYGVKLSLPQCFAMQGVEGQCTKL